MLKSEALVLVAQFPDNEFSNIFRKHRNARIGEAKKNQQVGTTRTNNRFPIKTFFLGSTALRESAGFGSGSVKHIN